MTDIQRAMLGDHEAAARLTEQGVLIPCSLCGDDEEVSVERYFAESWVHCNKCNCDGPLKIGDVNAIVAWNTRAPLLTPEQIERLEEMK